MSRANLPQRLLIIVVIALLYLVYLQSYQTRQHGSTISNGSVKKKAIVSMTTKENSYDYIAISNKYDYAAKHGYDMRFDYQGRRGVWDKLTDVEKAIREDLYDWIWWIDYDILITNHSIKIEDVLDHAFIVAEEAGKNPKDINLVVTPDCFPLNAGSMLFRSGSWVLDLFKEVWKCGDLNEKREHHYSEQDCIRDMIKDNTLHAGDRSVRVGQTIMNAFPEEIPCYEKEGQHWQRGMFAIHFAGAWAHMGDEKDPVGVLMRKYGQMVV